MDWFALNKMFSPLLSAVPAALVALGLGVLLLWLTPWKRMGRTLVTLGTVLLAGASWGPVADRIAGPLEARYAPFVWHEGVKDVQWVVVLGGGHISDPRLPLTGQIDESSLVRLAEGIRIHRLLPRSRIILSGGRLFDTVSHAQVLAEMAKSLGVDPRAMVLESTSRHTEEQAREIHRILGEDPFVLVTSAIHMPRAMFLCEARGMRPIPAPTGHVVRLPQGEDRPPPYPSAVALRKVQRAMHEYLGLAWIQLRAWFAAGQKA